MHTVKVIHSPQMKHMIRVSAEVCVSKAGEYSNGVIIQFLSGEKSRKEIKQIKHGVTEVRV